MVGPQRVKLPERLEELTEDGLAVPPSPRGRGLCGERQALWRIGCHVNGTVLSPNGAETEMARVLGSADRAGVLHRCGRDVRCCVGMVAPQHNVMTPLQPVCPRTVGVLEDLAGVSKLQVPGRVTNRTREGLDRFDDREAVSLGKGAVGVQAGLRLERGCHGKDGGAARALS